MVRLQTANPHAPADAVNEAFEIVLDAVVGGWLAVGLYPVEIGLREFVQGVGMAVVCVTTHDLVELLQTQSHGPCLAGTVCPSLKSTSSESACENTALVLVTLSHS